MPNTRKTKERFLFKNKNKQTSKNTPCMFLFILSHETGRKNNNKFPLTMFLKQKQLQWLTQKNLYNITTMEKGYTSVALNWDKTSTKRNHIHNPYI